MIDEIDFIAEHREADMSNVNRIIINGKVYLAADKVLEIPDEVSHESSRGGVYWNSAQTVKVLRRRIMALKGGEQE